MYSEILGKPIRNLLWWSFFLGFRPAILVKKILINNRFSVNGCEYLWTAASDLGKYLTTQSDDRGYSMMFFPYFQISFGESGMTVEFIWM